MVGINDYGWDKFYSKRKLQKKYDKLVRAISFTDKNKNSKIAYDIGAGIGIDSVYLAKNNFKVLAFDNNKDLTLNYEQICNDFKNISFFLKNIEDIEINDADFINANLVFPFIEKSQQLKLLEKINLGTNPGGIFSGNFFGYKDSRTSLSLMNKNTLYNCFSNWEIIFLAEIENKRQTSIGYIDTHTFEVICRKL